MVRADKVEAVLLTAIVEMFLSDSNLLLSLKGVGRLGLGTTGAVAGTAAPLEHWTQLSRGWGVGLSREGGTEPMHPGIEGEGRSYLN